ncbi:hypothetical protein HN865_05680 [Candidatus Woesearchaeota archaeon]|jgi:hypothetical protein|nr:hypothetical protein [Candidatus Woesearchaeota archaeon]MBT7238309.1 hypothetical protein [Candidatus Woesearchaeota archaeon]
MTVDDLCKDCIVREDSYTSTSVYQKRRERILNHIPQCLVDDTRHNMMVYLKENDHDAYRDMILYNFPEV